MEYNCVEGIYNNVFGIQNLVEPCEKYEAERFMMVSTDKAVNPTNVMDATKRMCEMIVQSASTYGRVKYSVTRFGNVLGSAGSVIPLFKRQIANGDSVTLTDKRIIRYFMTIPEAVSLVLLAGTYAKGGEIFVLDMGEPVKIDTLARNLIRLSGYTPDVDIQLTYTGLRPGEKLYEEKLMAEEGLKKTKNDLIHIGCPIPFDIEEFLEQLDGLLEAAYKNKDDMKERVQKVVSTYHPA